MFQNIGPFEIGVIIIVALLIFGPAKLPELGRSIGKAIQEFRKAGKEVTKEIKETLSEDEEKKS